MIFVCFIYVFFFFFFFIDQELENKIQHDRMDLQHASDKKVNFSFEPGQNIFLLCE